MGLGGCYSILKYVLVFFNFIFGLLGITGIVFSVWMLVDPTFSFTLTQEYTDYLISVIIILVASILLVVVAFFGILGCLKENQCALTTFFSLLLIIFVAEISAAVWVYINSDSLELQVKNSVKLTVEQEYYHKENRRQIFDTFQKNLHCCGAEKPADWMGSSAVLISVISDAKKYNIPKSCCRPEKSELECDAATQGLNSASNIDFNVVYDRGCYTLVVSELKNHAFLLFSIGVGVAIIQILALVFSLILAFAVNRSNRYKA